MRLWHIAVAFLIIQSTPAPISHTSGSLTYPKSSLSMAADDTFTPNRDSRTPSPGPVQQPSSGPNPVFDPSPQKKRGGQPMSIKVKRQRLAKKAVTEEQEGWSPEQTAAEQSRIMQEKLAEAAAEKATRDIVAAVKADRERTARIQEALQALKKAGCKTTYQFFEEFFSSTDREISKQASRLMHDHGADLLDLLHAKRPEIVEKWALKVSLPVIAAEGAKLAAVLRPDPTKDFTSRLETWSLEKMLAEALDMEIVTASCPIFNLAQTSSRTCKGSVADTIAKVTLAWTRPRRTPSSAYSDLKLPPQRLTQCASSIKTRRRCSWNRGCDRTLLLNSRDAAISGDTKIRCAGPSAALCTHIIDLRASFEEELPCIKHPDLPPTVSPCIWQWTRVEKPLPR
ncbi:hypothetical protein B0H19DRAFT_1025508 [Mycena capillaripes]|nr:hypothetical protein B0H19DRAFT_1025508 [Mycena capillaripes]